MALQTHHLSRRFGDRLAVDDASFRIERGRLTGFVGANGAGKTTVMRMILGVLAPSAGTVTLDGVALDQTTRRSFGYMPEERGLYPKMPLREQMLYFAQLHGLNKHQAAHNSDDLLETLGLTERAKDPIESLSLGNQQRAQVAVSLVHHPAALILDEPFSGLDPMAVDVILSVLTQNASRGIPVLLSSHQLDVVERLCDDIVIISDGRIVAAGSIAALRQEFNRGQYRIETSQDLTWVVHNPGVTDVSVSNQDVPYGEAALPSARRRVSGRIGGAAALAGDQIPPYSPHSTATFRADSDAAAQRVLSEAVGRGPVASFGPVTTPLAEIFREVVEIRDGGDTESARPATKRNRSQSLWRKETA